MKNLKRLLWSGLLTTAAAAGGIGALSAQSAPPVSAIEYQLTFTRASAATRSIDVAMRFTAGAAGPVELSLPAWTPGAYELSFFAKRVLDFRAMQGAQPLRWDKRDYDTWRVQVGSPGPVEVRFRFLADTLDNAMAWAREDFAFVNGTNVFLYPEGSDLSFPAAVRVETEADWQVATGMNVAGARRFDAQNYHDLVDMPFFVGRIELDSLQVEGRWHRLATYPVGALAGPNRQTLWRQIQTMVPTMSRVFGETPWQHYTTMLVFDSGYGGGSALEHQNSHVGIYHPGFAGSEVLASITAHEIFHAWNVKLLRPADLVPYRYDRAQPTTLLWVSEGITDYYADLALVRAGIIDSAVFLSVTGGKQQEVDALPPVALEDASLSTWIQPNDGTGTIYYPKGSLAGLLLDILIRDASDNKASLDDVMRALYRSTAKTGGRGFTTEDWWRAVGAAAGRPDFTDFAARYIDGRDPFPWASVGPLAGIRIVVDSVLEPRIGVATHAGADGREVITQVAPGSAAAAAGLRDGDELVRVGDIAVDADFGALFRMRYRRRIGEAIPVVVRREGRDLTVSLVVRGEQRIERQLEYDRRASLKAARIRSGILRGTTG